MDTLSQSRLRALTLAVEHGGIVGITRRTARHWWRRYYQEVASFRRASKRAALAYYW